MPYICDIIFTYLLIIMKNKSVILLLFLAICGLTEAKAVANDEAETFLLWKMGDFLDENQW